MNIACLGWGSLIWRPEALQILGKWFDDGPLLPIEFTRQSDNGRMTLIIDPIAKSVRTLWALMSVDSLPAAIKSLKEREGVKKDNLIHSANVNDEEGDNIRSTIINWMKFHQLDSAIWTGLSYSEKTDNQRPTIDYVLKHLRDANYEVRRIAEEYIRKAPKQIDTSYRRRIEQEFGWTYLE
jgi:hypothetical protein